MFGSLLRMAGLFGMSLLCILFGHKWTRKLARKRLDHGCQNCGGKGYVPYRPEGSTVPSYKRCDVCDGSGEDPNNPSPTKDMTRREKKQYRKEHRDDNAEWLKDRKKVKVVWPNCVRCGKANPNWKDPNDPTPPDPWWLRLIVWLMRKVAS